MLFLQHQIVETYRFLCSEHESVKIRQNPSKSVKKNSDAQVGHVNTFHILQTTRPKLQTLYEKTLNFFKFLNSECVVLFLDPE
jgi:hypothetical protein